VTSSETAGIRDRAREPGAPPDEGEPMSGRGVLPGRRGHRQRPSPASEHRELYCAHRPQALVTRTPTWRQQAGTRRLGERGRSPDPPRSLLTGPSRGRTSEAGDAHAHVIAAKKAGHDVGRDQVARLMAVSGIRGRRASPRADDKRRLVPTSLPTSFTGSFTRNARTRAESRTGHHSTPPKRWPTSLTSTPEGEGAGSSAGRSVPR